jgi:broad-specificity NMP kinase
MCVYVCLLNTARKRVLSLMNILFAGGPGSGKVTHCDALATEKRGFVHINMTDLLQQFAVGNGKSSFLVETQVFVRVCG